MKLNKFLTTTVGSLLKTFFWAMVAFAVKEVIAAESFAALGDIKALLWASLWSGLIAVANVIHNWNNPEYQGYGKRN